MKSGKISPIILGDLLLNISEGQVMNLCGETLATPPPPHRIFGRGKGLNVPNRGGGDLKVKRLVDERVP